MQTFDVTLVAEFNCRVAKKRNFQIYVLYVYIFGTGKYLDGGREEEWRGYLRKMLFCQHCSVRCTVVVVSLHLQMANDRISPELRYNFIQVLPPPQKSHWPDG